MLGLVQIKDLFYFFAISDAHVHIFIDISQRFERIVILQQTSQKVLCSLRSDWVIRNVNRMHNLVIFQEVRQIYGKFVI